MSRTRFLCAIAVAAVLMQVLPKYAESIKWVAIGGGVLYLIVRALRTYPKQYRLKKQLAAQRLADEREFRQYDDELARIRAKYHAMAGVTREDDPDGSEGDYERELAALNERHRNMLERKFGRI